MSELETNVAKILEILQGNGDPGKGMVVRLALLERSVSACQLNSTSRRRDIRWWATTLVAVGAVLVAVFK